MYLSHKHPPTPLHLPIFALLLEWINVSLAIIRRGCYHQYKIYLFHRLLQRVAKGNITRVSSKENISTNKAQPLQQVTPDQILRVNPPAFVTMHYSKTTKKLSNTATYGDQKTLPKANYQSNHTCGPRIDTPRYRSASAYLCSNHHNRSTTNKAGQVHLTPKV